MGEYTPQSRSEEILYDTIHSLEYTERPQSRIEELLLELKAVIEAGSGTSDYDDLENKPSINNVELSGDKSLADLGAASEGAVAAKANQSDIAPAFSDAIAYIAGDVVYYEGSLYRFTADHAAGAWDSADVEPVTVDDLVDGLKPVDSITDGNMSPVTSNAVADALKQETVTITKESGDTYATILARLFAAMDFTKLKPTSKLVVGGTSVYSLTAWASDTATFNRSVIYSASSNYAELNVITVRETSTCVTMAISASSIRSTDFTSLTAPDAITIYY